MDEMILREGSHARNPHTSSRWNPLCVSLLNIRSNIASHLMQSISIRCCSARLFSLFTFLCNAVKMLVRASNALPHCLFSSRSSSFGIPVVMSVLAIPPGFVIAKYSSSSRRTMMACLESKGF